MSALRAVARHCGVGTIMREGDSKRSHTPLSAWTFALEAEDGTKIMSWSWDEFRALGQTDVTVDIHCVTRWSKVDTDWRGISVAVSIASIRKPRRMPQERF